MLTLRSLELWGPWRRKAKGSSTSDALSMGGSEDRARRALEASGEPTPQEQAGSLQHRRARQAAKGAESGPPPEPVTQEVTWSFCEQGPWLSVGSRVLLVGAKHPS